MANKYRRVCEVEDGQLPNWCAQLPAVNASLNAVATVLLAGGWAAIRSGRQRLHKALMLSSFGVSVVFLGCYLAYHIGLHHYTGSHGKAFEGTGAIRAFYFTMLISHVVLAAAVPVLALMAIYHGLKANWPRHRRIGKIALPIWLYVSITGVGIYFMLYGV